MNLLLTDPQPIQGYPGDPTERRDDVLGLWALIRMLHRRWLVIASVGLIAAVTAYAGTILQRPVYRATSLVMVNPRQEQVLRSSENVVAERSPDSALVDSEIEVIRSQPLASRLVESLSLEDDPEWNYRLRPPSQLDAIKHRIKEVLTPPTRQFAPAPATPAAADVRDEIAGAVSSSIHARRRGMSYVIEITAQSGRPATAQKLTNTLVDLYIQSHIEARTDSTRRANNWLSQRIDELRQDLQRKEQAIEEFRAESGLLAVAGTSLTEQQITNIQNSVLEAQATLAEKEARLRQLRDVLSRGSSPATIGEAMNSAVIRELRAREADIARRQSELENRYLSNHPSVLNIRAERADIQAQIQEEMQRISANLQNEVQVARSRLQTLQQSLGEARGELVGGNAADVRLRQLEREAAAARGVYESYLQRFQEIADQDRLQSTEVRLVAYAQVPRAPFFPNPRLALWIALAVGMTIGVAAGLLVELLDRTISSADDLEEKLGVPAIASVPKLRPSALKAVAPTERNPVGYLIEKPMSAFAEAIRVLRTAVVYAQLDRAKRVVAITSAVPGEGKTTMSLCLARTAAMAGENVLVIDCDLRRRSINAVLDVEPTAGLLQVLAGEIAWRDAVKPDPLSHADILPLSEASFSPRDVFGSEPMHRLIEELRAQYDLIILDCPPLLAVAETRIAVMLADFVVVVALWGKSATRAVRSTIEQTRATGVPVLGVALNCVDVNAPGRYSYADTLYYHQAKKHYYAS